MAIFAPTPPLPLVSRRLQPELLPTAGPAGSFIAGPGSGVVAITGTPVSQLIGQAFGVGAGLLDTEGAPVALAMGEVGGFNVGAGAATGFGFFAALAITQPTAPVVSDIAAFTPALSELGVDIWERLGMQVRDLSVTHIASMRRSMNLVLVRWSNRGINLWEITNTAIDLLPGVATYTLPANLIELLDSYRRITVGGINTDIIMAPISRNDYAALPNKATPGAPTQYWFNRQIIPTLTVWPVPDAATRYQFVCYAWNQIADADPSGNNTANLPYRFLEAFTANSAAHLSMKWAPERAEKLKAYGDECFVEAADQDREVVTLNMAPNLGAYFD